MISFRRLPGAAPTLFVTLMALSAAVSPVLAAQWHVSDEHGVVRDSIDEDARDEYDYVMRIDRDGSAETHTLYHEGEPIERTELEYADGRLRVRRFFRDGESVATEYFAYWGDGSLRNVRRVSERGTTVEYRYRDGRLTEEWVTTGEAVEVVRYDKLGRVVERTLRADGDVLERETREYWGPATEDTIRRVVVVADGAETVYRYDESGRLLGSSVARGGAVESDRTRIFEDGQLVEEREEIDGVLKVWRYEYEGDELARERIYEDGALVKVTEYGGEVYTRTERLYRDGAEVLRVYYRGQERMLEEVIRDGEVVRTREIGPEEGE